VTHHWETKAVRLQLLIVNDFYSVIPFLHRHQVATPGGTFVALPPDLDLVWVWPAKLPFAAQPYLLLLL